MCAVVKADGYGHGAVECGRAALAGGATWLAVAAAAEAAALRVALPEARLLVLGALTPAELDLALGAGADIAVWRRGFLELVQARAGALGVRPRVHVKYDTGMGRLGERDPAAVADLVAKVSAVEEVELTGFWTHFATADEPGSEFFAEQLERFTGLADRVRREHPGLIRHAANSAATLSDDAAHFEMVRCGVAVYGLDPFGEDPAARELEPALELRSYVADVKEFEPGDSAGYGRSWRAQRDTRVGVLPIGYGDGVRRALSNNADVLVDGRRHPLVGTVSMDNVTIDLGPRTTVEPGERRGPDRRPGRREDPRRGARRAPADDQLRDRLRDLVAGPPAVRAIGMSAADRLSAAEPLRIAREALSDDDEAWIVGGAVRDALAGRVVGVSTSRSPATRRTAARRIARAAGGPAFALSGEFGDLAGAGARSALAPRRDQDARRLDRGRPGRARLHRQRDRGPARGPAARRSTLIGGSPTSSSGGCGWSPSAVSPTTRCGCCAPRGSQPSSSSSSTPETVALARARPTRAAEPAGERQFAELRLLLAGPDPLRGLGLLDELEVTAAVLPELEALRGVDQNPNHHLDVHGHTIEVLRALLEIERDLDRYARRRRAAVARAARRAARRRARREAARCASRRSSTTSASRRPERSTRAGSSRSSATTGSARSRPRAVRPAADQPAPRRYLEAVTLHHLHLGFMVRERPLSRRRLYEYLKLTEPVSADVSLLTVADRLAARGRADRRRATR